MPRNDFSVLKLPMRENRKNLPRKKLSEFHCQRNVAPKFTRTALLGLSVYHRHPQWPKMAVELEGNAASDTVKAQLLVR